MWRFFGLFLALNSLWGEISLRQQQALYHSLDPQSVAQHLAFYELYGDQKALDHAWTLMHGEGGGRGLSAEMMGSVEALIGIVNQPQGGQHPLLKEEDLEAIEPLARQLAHRQLLGHGIRRGSEALQLKANQIDLARALFLNQFEDNISQVRSYEAMIDLMALQVKARLAKEAAPEEIIREMNRFVFEEMGFRFPPHSEHAKDIDQYSFLPSVLDSRRGVCLGVSILYLCLAQRLGVPMEIITPPGHIYVRYRNGEKIINVETTARGIHVDCKEYLSVDTRSLQQRTLKEVIGMVPFNQAAALWSRDDYAGVLKCYRQAETYMPDDLLLKELMAYALLLTDHPKEGWKILEWVKDHLPEHAVSKNTTAEDYLLGKLDNEGLKALFMHVDENRDSLLNKKATLEKVLEKHPHFRSGLFSLAITHLQLHREKEALETLEQYHKIYPHDPNAEYILASLHTHRYNDNKAWHHLRNAERLTAARNHSPEVLKSLRRSLSHLSPE